MKKPDIKIVEVFAIIVGGLSLIFMHEPTPVLIGKITVAGGILFALWLILPFKTLKSSLSAAVQKLPKPLVYMFDGAGIAIIIMIAGYIGYQKVIVQRFAEDMMMEENVEAIKSIAVLAFDDMSPDKDQEYFCDGLAEELINAMTYIKKLRVISRNSSFTFKGQHPDIREVGEKLGVNHVLEGSVRKSGDDLRITAQLIKVSDGSHLWSKTYDHKMDDIFAIQEDLSLSVVKELRITLMGSEHAALEKQPTENVEAYRLYLLSKSGKGLSFQQKIDYLKEAIELDPAFALAYVDMAGLYSMQIAYGQLTKEDGLNQYDRAMKKAYSLDENLSEYHTELARKYIYFGWDWSKAFQSLNKALDLNPGYESAHGNMGRYYRIMGDIEKALEETELIKKINPLNPGSYNQNILLYAIMGKYTEGIQEYHSGKEIAPDNIILDSWLARLYIKKGDYEKARGIYEGIQQKLREDGKDPESFMFQLVYVAARQGDRVTVEKAIEKIRRTVWKDIGGDTSLAMLYAGLGDADKAIEWAEKAYEARDPLLAFIKTDIEWDPVRSDPRFQELLRKIGLPED